MSSAAHRAPSARPAGLESCTSATEHVSDETAHTPSLSQRVPATQKYKKKTHCNTRGGRNLNGQPKVLPCVFAGSGVSATPQRLWPGAQWTIAVQGPKGERLLYCVRKRQRGGEVIAISPRPPERPGAFAKDHKRMRAYSRKTRTSLETQGAVATQMRQYHKITYNGKPA